MKYGLVRKFLFPLYYFLALCPFVSPVYMPVDVKPYCLIVALVILLLIPEKIVVPEFFVNICLISSVGFLIMLSQILLMRGGGHYDFIFLPLRKCVNYISLSAIGLAGFNIFLHDGEPNELIIKRMILLWLAAGIIELFFPNFMQVITPGARSGFGVIVARGVTGLSMEPSFYGYTCFFFMILAAKFKTGRVCYCALCVFQIVFLAQSATGVLYLFVLTGVYVFFTASIRKKIVFLIIFAVSMAVILSVIDRIEILRQSRMTGLFMAAFNNPDASMNTLESIEMISESDASVATRIYAITFGVGNFFKDAGIPHGFLYSGRVMSGYGAVLYELGIMGLAIIIMITRRLYRAFSLQAAIAVSIVMLSAVQLTSPTFIFLVAVAEYEFYTKRRRKFLSA